MKRRAASWMVRVGAGLVLALLLGDFASPSAARADCGDHQTARRVGAGPTKPLPSPLPPTCTGPSCSRPRNEPFAPAPTKIASPDPAALSTEAAPDRPAGRRWPRGGERPLPARNDSSIFHPPR